MNLTPTNWTTLEQIMQTQPEFEQPNLFTSTDNRPRNATVQANKIHSTLTFSLQIYIVNYLNLPPFNWQPTQNYDVSWRKHQNPQQDLLGY